MPFPAALKPYAQARRWVVWRLEEAKSGKPTKVPYRPDHPTWKAKSDDPSTWSDLASALEVAERNGFDGIGLELFDGKIGAFDIDHCRDSDSGEIEPKVMELVGRCNTYTEITPSGTGLRIIGLYRDEPKQGRKAPLPGARNGVTIEPYPACKRFITVTGDHLDGTPTALADITDVMDEVLAGLDAPKQDKGNGKAKSDSDDAEVDSELPQPLGVRLFIPDEGAGKPHAGYTSRSELLFAFLADAIRANVNAKRIVAVCLDPAHKGHAIYEHCHDRGGKQYVERQIQQAREKIKADLDERLAKINEDYAMVLAGNKASVMKFENIGGRTQFRLLQVGSFRQWHANQQVTVGKKVTTIGECWLSHPQRRQYHDIEFAPTKGRDGYYNLWRGFTVKPQEGDCSKFLAHIWENAAQKDDEHFKWIMSWWAQIFQQPGKKLGTALAIRGRQGTGKTKIGDKFGSLLGEHYELVADQRYVTGQFNSHMASLVLLHADEAFWAGDKRAEGKLKDLITGLKHRLEFKGIEPILVDNHIRLFITANHEWVVPAGFDERRFAVFDIGENHVRDYDYFAAIDNEWDHGGKEAMLHYLLGYNIKYVNLREIPKTRALLEQIMATATPEQAWWFDTLVNGTLPFGVKEPNTCPKWTLYRRYIRHAMLQGARRRQIETKLGIFLRTYVGPELKGDKKQDYVVVNRYGQHQNRCGYVYEFPSLKECRDRFVAAIGQEVKWNSMTAWEHEQMGYQDDDDLPF